MFDLPLVTDEKFIRGKRVLLRATFNVPIKDGKVENDFRIRKAIPTIEWLRDHGAKVIIISHIWGDEITSLKVVYEYLNNIMSLKFVPDCIGKEADEVIKNMDDGDVVLLENTRLHDGEVGNKEIFAEKLAKHGDIYVNDAFPVSHREHASIIGIPQYIPSYIGIQFKKELDNLSMALNPQRPFLFVLGGAKFSTKMPLIRKFLNKADNVYVGGALIKPFLMEKGIVVHDEHVPPNLESVSDIVNNPKLHIPIDVICNDGDNSENLEAEKCTVKEGNIVDIGESSLNDVKGLISKSKFVLWNGPLGDYEEGFSTGTKKFAEILIASGAKSVIGGGDTIAVLAREGIDYENAFTFTSTAGGAMLQFLSDETLPGIEAILSQKAHPNKNKK